MNPMTTSTKRQWAQNYITGIANKEEQQIWEVLLIDDPEALEIHMQLLTCEELQLPDLEYPSQFTDTVMNQLPKEPYCKAPISSESKRRWYEHSFVHYAVAACLTVIFLSTGLFDKVMYPDLSTQDTYEGVSFSNQMMNITINWLDQFK
ncbi:hypothetical protein [Paenibacillus sp. IHBB 10380]|uniref:hypothetical protein n=1 Tax=Paenibacillus sp. IHBB 10380 TaxID=1566358 RepID=UPI0006971CC5|nr:hypothetical protein [Paenibacillus sp. IHBB 10380]